MSGKSVLDLISQQLGCPQLNWNPTDDVPNQDGLVDIHSDREKKVDLQLELFECSRQHYGLTWRYQGRTFVHQVSDRDWDGAMIVNNFELSNETRCHRPQQTGQISVVSTERWVAYLRDRTTTDVKMKFSNARQYYSDLHNTINFKFGVRLSPVPIDRGYERRKQEAIDHLNSQIAILTAVRNTIKN